MWTGFIWLSRVTVALLWTREWTLRSVRIAEFYMARWVTFSLSIWKVMSRPGWCLYFSLAVSTIHLYLQQINATISEGYKIACGNTKLEHTILLLLTTKNYIQPDYLLSSRFVVVFVSLSTEFLLSFLLNRPVQSPSECISNQNYPYHSIYL
jgi:hypothetical protein